MNRSPCYLLVLLAVCLHLSSAFVPSKFEQRANINHKKYQPIATLNTKKQSTSSARHISVGSIGSYTTNTIGAIGTAFSSLATPLRRHAKLLLILLTTLATVLISTKKKSSLLWPGTYVNDNDSEYPLPPGSYGCPFIGNDIFGGSNDYGIYAGLHKLARKMKDNSIFKSYSLGMPIISITGMDNIKTALKNEFKEDGINMAMVGSSNMADVLGDKSILYENKSSTHGTLRRIMGTATSPAAINDALPSIQEAASSQIDMILQQAKDGEEVEMEKIFFGYTLDLAWKQILGLDLMEDEVPTFHQAVKDWTTKLGDVWLLLPFRIPGLLTLTKVGKARIYLESKVEEKLEKLDRDGPDNSTLSKLYFAIDEETGERMSKKQVIDNALILILAGSETSASALTSLSLLLGLHPNVFQKIKAEQREVCAKYGDELTKESINECVYLDAVIKETLRMKPLEAMEMRQVSDSNMVVDGKRIPKNWLAILNVKNTHWEDPVVYKEDGSHMDVKKGFVPERWLDESTKPGAWMPFGDGKRRCVGERLAWVEMKVIMSILSRRIDYELVNEDSGSKWKPNAFMPRPLDGVLVKATPAV